MRYFVSSVAVLLTFAGVVAAQDTAENTKARILVIAGAPTWDYRMLQRQYQRNEDISLSCWLQTMSPDRPQEGNQQLGSLPNPDQLSDFDAIIMLDPDPEAFSAEWTKSLSRACQQGSGLVYVAGPKHSLKFLTADSLRAVRELLPVEFGELDPDKPLDSPENRAGRMSVVSDNSDHPVLTLDTNDETNTKLWDTLPGIYWSFPVVAAKPESQTLLQHPDNSPAMVTAESNNEKVLFVSFTGTWRWRRAGQQAEYYEKFWNNLAKFAAQGDR